MESFHGPVLSSLKEARSVAPDMGSRGVEEHSAIVDAIEQRRLDLAQEILGTHLRRTAERVTQGDSFE